MPNEEDKKLDYLKREDIGTMEKDLAKLREKEAEIEREKIAGLKTEEHLKLEQEKAGQARIEAAERQRMEEEAARKEKELKILREQRERKEAEMEKGEAGAIESRKGEFREQLRGTQQREEEERKRFIERISAKAEGREPAPPVSPETPPIPPEIPSAPPVPPIPPTPVLAPLLPPIPPAPPKQPFKFPSVKLPKVQLPKVLLPKINGYFPHGLFLEKLWIRIIISLLVFAILIAVATFWYWYLVVREAPQTTTPQPTPPIIQEPETAKLFINERILDFGYHITPEPRTIDTIIIHSIYDALGDDPYDINGIIEEYKIYGVAAHYLIAGDGQIYQTAPREAVAYHAGISQMPDGRTDVNNFSIGVELIYTKNESPTENQYLALSRLVGYLQKEYNIPSNNILGHKDIAPDRKDDPWNFDWGKLVEK